jgi:hypothetical protein
MPTEPLLHTCRDGGPDVTTCDEITRSLARGVGPLVIETYNLPLIPAQSPEFAKLWNALESREDARHIYRRVLRVEPCSFEPGPCGKAVAGGKVPWCDCHLPLLWAALEPFLPNTLHALVAAYI